MLFTFIFFLFSSIAFSSDEKKLSKAVDRHKWDKAEELLNEGVNPNVENDGEPILIEMITYNQQELISLALQKGANVNVKGRWGDTPLIKATLGRKIDIVKLLIENGADVNLKGKMGDTALMKVASAGSIQLLELLVEQGADLNIQNNYGKTALHKAVASKKQEAVDFLISKGADQEIKDDNGKSYLTYLKEDTRYWLIVSNYKDSSFQYSDELWYDSIEGKVVWAANHDLTNDYTKVSGSEEEILKHGYSLKGNFGKNENTYWIQDLPQVDAHTECIYYANGKLSIEVSGGGYEPSKAYGKWSIVEKKRDYK
jgi:hypothetical protein